MEFTYGCPMCDWKIHSEKLREEVSKPGVKLSDVYKCQKCGFPIAYDLLSD